MMRLLYTSAILLYGLAARLAAPFNGKAKLWTKGRKASRNKLEGLVPDEKQWLWFHAASLGEFEQGRTVIEAIRKTKPQYRILLTFFSPSGYEIRKNYEHADLVLYLPEDSPSNMNDICNRFHFKAVFFIKYEFWFNLLHHLERKKIPFYFFSVRFRPEQHFFRWYGGWFLKHLSFARHIFVQDETSLRLMRHAGISQCSIAGDTRFDRVAQLAHQSAGIPEIEHFVGSSPLFVAGSTWPADEKLLIPLLTLLPENYKIIIAPHDVSNSHIERILYHCKSAAVRFSAMKTNPNARILVIDNIGLLSRIYRYARFAYIGGGFGKAIHNIQEPIAWGRPVIFGPKHQKFTEATDLLALGGAFAVENQKQLGQAMLALATNNELIEQASSACKSYLQRNIGATELIMSTIDI